MLSQAIANIIEINLKIATLHKEIKGIRKNQQKFYFFYYYYF
jgi:hypothetical protein